MVVDHEAKFLALLRAVAELAQAVELVALYLGRRGRRPRSGWPTPLADARVVEVLSVNSGPLWQVAMPLAEEQAQAPTSSDDSARCRPDRLRDARA